MSNFNFIAASLKDAYIIEPKCFRDNRGYFLESYQKEAFAAAGLTVDFVQDNESFSSKGVLRGLHFQTKYPQGKLIRVIQGSVYDVAVDLRRGSPTFGQWQGVELNDQNKRMFYVPEGFAHGFLVLSDTAVFTYKCTNYYAPQYDSGIIWNDPTIAIDWPIADDMSVILSEKDGRQQSFADFAKKDVFVY